MGKRWAAAAMAALMMTAPAPAACWQTDEAGAATVRQLQSMLMVAALRCQVARHDITADYNAFVAANRGTIGRMNDRLKARFVRQAGPVDGQVAYDAFTTMLANGYGAAASGAEACEAMGSLAREAALMAGSAEGLMLLSGRAGIAPALADGVCAAGPVVIADATRSLRALPAVIGAAATPEVAAGPAVADEAGGPGVGPPQ